MTPQELRRRERADLLMVGFYLLLVAALAAAVVACVL